MKKLLLILLYLPLIGFGQQTYVPNDEFESNLISLGYDSVMDDSVNTSSIDTVTQLQLIFMWNNGGLIGIEDFTSLKNLTLSHMFPGGQGVGNTSLDFSNNVFLEYLSCPNFYILNLDVSSCISLKYLNCNGNNIANLNINNLTSLETLICSNNNLANLNINNLTSLETLICSNNNLANLNLSNLTSLDSIICFSNNITSLDVTDCTSLEVLWCSTNNLTTLDLSNCTTLLTLSCWDNQLTTLDLSQNVLLELLYCSNNSLTILDIINNPFLYQLECYNNNLISLNVNGAVSLSIISCYDNLLECLDVSNNTSLTELYCNDNLLDRLNTQNGNWQNMYVDARSNNLTCVEVDNIGYSTNNWNFDSFTTLSTNCNYITTCNPVSGCTDSTACNYIPNATIDDSTCVYNQSYTNIVSSCDLYIWDGFTFDSTGQYTNVYSASNSCDSIVTLDLTITGNPNAQIIQFGFDLQILPTGGVVPYVYLWNTLETTQVITPSNSGIYWCLITDANGCNSDTVFYNYTTSSIDEINTDKKLLKITDLLGRETKGSKNQPLLYIYDDGTVEKRITID